MAGESEENNLQSYSHTNETVMVSSDMNLDALREKVRRYIDMHLYQAAIFWADKVASFSNEEPQDVYWLAQSLYYSGQYHRAAICIKSRNLHKFDSDCRYLAAKCHYLGKEYKEALDVLTVNDPNGLSKLNINVNSNGEDQSSCPEKTPKEVLGVKRVGDEKSFKNSNKILKSVAEDPSSADKSSKETFSSKKVNSKKDSKKREEIVNSITDDPRIASAILLLKGQIYEAMDNRGLAAECFREALQQDTYCYDAFESLVQHQMLTKDEELQLVESLPFESQCPADDPNIVKLLYEIQLKKYDKPSDLIIPPELSTLSGNLDIGTALAERCYYNCDYEQCYKITTSILNKDPFHLDCLPIHISCLMEMEKNNALFYLAHKLVDFYPESAVAWYAVGCYYFQIGKTDAARRYLSKSTTLNKVYGPAWLMYGHSFAIENEHDQAMAAYCRASQLMKGCHLPLLYIGLEYGLSNNIKLAERFFNQAQAIAPEDPFVLHELGVVAFQNVDYQTSYAFFQEALKRIQTSDQTVLPVKWEPLLNNLGHACRKLRKYEEAITYHENALILIPQNPTTFAAIGFVYSLTRKWAEAVEYFHKALGLQRDDVFSNTMLTTCMEQLVKETSPCIDYPDELLDYPCPPEIASDTCNPREETSDIMTEIITDDIQSEIIPEDSLNDLTQNTSVSMDVDMEGVE